MDFFSEIVRELGGGLPAVVLVALGYFSWRILTWWRDDVRESSAAVLAAHKETVDALTQSAEAIRALTEEVRRNGK